MVLRDWPRAGLWISGSKFAILTKTIIAQGANPWVCDRGPPLFAQRRSRCWFPVYDSNVGRRRCKRGILPLDEPGIFMFFKGLPTHCLT